MENNGKIDTWLRLGLPQFHKDHEEPVPEPTRVCAECDCSQGNTPTWRRGPEGPGTLCNACGLKFMRKQKNERNAGYAKEHLVNFACLQGRL